MAITTQDAVLELRREVPSFAIDREWEAEDLSYPIFNDFARFICSEAEVLQYVETDEEKLRFSKVPSAMHFLEHLLEQGDSTVHDLIQDCVETLLDCPRDQKIKKWAGPLLLAIWNVAP